MILAAVGVIVARNNRRFRYVNAAELTLLHIFGADVVPAFNFLWIGSLTEQVLE